MTWTLPGSREVAAGTMGEVLLLTLPHTLALRFAGPGEYVIDWGGYRVYLGRDGENLVVLFGGGTKRRQQRDINKAKELLVEQEARTAKLTREKAGQATSEKEEMIPWH